MTYGNFRRAETMSEHRRGFTLIEFLVVIAIIVILIGLVIPATRRSCGAAHRVRCQNNMKQILLAMHNHADTHPGTKTLPAGCFGAAERSPEQRLSWLVELLPYLEESTLFQQIDPKRGFDPQATETRKPITMLRCSLAADTQEPITTYVAMAGIGDEAVTRPGGSALNGIMGYNRATTFAEITDGTSNTIAVAETHSYVGVWAQGGTATLRAFDPQNPNLFGESGWFGSPHHGGFTAGYADGSVRFIRFTVSPSIFADHVTIAGGETSTLD
jgi:prepilin-type N-terminal cleavage/methylation domain-containing protein